jgi:hypothetical protein
MKRIFPVFLLLVSLSAMAATEIPTLAVFQRQEDRMRSRRARFQSLCRRRAALTDAISYRMAESGYRLLEREEVGRIIAEFDLLESEWASRKGSGWDAGIIAADLILLVDIRRIEWTTKERIIRITGERTADHRASANATLTLVRVATGEIEKSWTGTVRITAREIRDAIPIEERRDWSDQDWADAGTEIIASEMVSKLLGESSEDVEPLEPDEPQYPKTETPTW